MRYTIRHRKPYRTRIQFLFLRGRPALCSELEDRLQDNEDFARVKIRPQTGSIIFEHPKKQVLLPTIITRVKALADVLSGTALQPAVQPSSTSAGRSRSDKNPYHVSGLTLVFSGLYLLYLSVKRVLGTIAAPAAMAARVFTLPAIVAIGLSLPIQRHALDNLKKNGRPDMGLISTGLLYASILTGSVLPALTVFWLFNLSSWLEDRIRIRTRTAVREMLTGNVQSVWVVKGGVELEVDIDSVGPGDSIALRPGNIIPVDGVVVDGESLVNEASLTGESMLISKADGDRVFAGTVIEEGHVIVRVEKAGEETRLASIISLIEEGENNPGKLQRMSEKFSQAMVPVSLSLAGLAFLFTGNLLQAMAVLIITCPCAIRLSTSVAASSGMSLAARQGILIKGGNYLELAGKVNVLVLDKTGTITDRASEIYDIEVFDKRFKEETLLEFAAAVQKHWQHPLSRAITGFAEERGVRIPECDSARLVVNRGVAGIVRGSEVLVGNYHFMKEQQVSFPQRSENAQSTFSCNGSQLFVARAGKVLGCFATRSNIRKDAAAGLSRLKDLNLDKLVLLTGDTRSGVKELAEQFNFDTVLSGQSPEDKANWIKDWKELHPDAVVAMVGDGINDTPAFAAADLSLAIGDGGADVTLEYADIVLQKGSIDQVANVLEIGRLSLQRMQDSYTIALGANGLLLFLTTFGWLSSVTGALLHNLTTVTAVSHAALTEKKK